MPQIDGNHQGDRLPVARALRCLPNLPSAQSRALPSSTPIWNALFLPGGTPPAIVQKLNAAAVQAMSMPAVQARLKNRRHRAAPERRTPEYLQKFVESEIRKWAGPIKAAGIDGE